MKKQPTPKSAAGDKERAKTSATKNLHHTEYNFDAVNPIHADACRFYEYARESQGIRDAVKRLREAIAAIQSAHPGLPFWPEYNIGDPQPSAPLRQTCIIGLFTSTDQIAAETEVSFSTPKNRDPEEFMREVFVLARMEPYFPESPWLQIEAQEVKQMLISILADNGLLPPPPLLLNEPKKGAKPYTFFFKVQEYFQQPTSDAIVRGEFQMDLAGDIREMHEQLDAFVRLTRERHNVVPLKATDGSPSPQTRLNQLGAMRMLWLMRTIEAARKCYGLYGDRWDYADACREALRHFNGNFALADDEAPIHNPPLRAGKRSPE